ncbi:L-lactate dehydrogenase complex protein LldG [Arthrobacter stackebrandtii]|uniref:L-lactate dehydrogenase complex protein LldG n=1 Tax=Arthrobacter stackebrandtii TaxID=272161 RepID=A0ABS4YVE8_9MICC|nr:lactate utilization protein C [Arthrobacter stackebrandtii]MBP2412781.1 L-lactate dehydrogenase complex protein LldG [Arthrobacter stackebrandtii]PYG99864.1 lactate utilization protein C [Arthrobacter stackebrandtii]
MSAREDIMNRIKSALRDAPATPVVPREYRRSSDMTAEQRLEQLVDRLVDYKANVFLTPAGDAPAKLAELLTGSTSIVVPHGLPESWLAALPSAGKDDGGTPAVHVDSPERRLTTAELDAVDAVVTAAAVAVSETGTIMLDGGGDQGRRIISLVPDRHICILNVDQIVEVLPEAIARLEASRPQTWISGPSATSDIELERVEGVHGPRTLDVIILT